MISSQSGGRDSRPDSAPDDPTALEEQRVGPDGTNPEPHHDDSVSPEDAEIDEGVENIREEGEPFRGNFA